MANVQLQHANHVGVLHESTGGELRLKALVATVAGGGFVNSASTTSLDLATAGVFQTLMVGNISTLTFANAADGMVWTWVLRVNGTGGYTLAGTLPTVTFLDGSAFSDARLTANAENVFNFWRVGGITYGALLTNGRLEPYVLSFPTNGVQGVPITRAETLDLSVAGVTNLELDGTAGTGTLSFKKNGGANLALAPTAFAAGEVLTVTLASATTASVVSIPRTT